MADTGECIMLGIDPGLATVGYGFLKAQGDDMQVIDFGVVETDADQPFAQRLLTIQTDLEHLIQLYEPTHACVEELFFSTNVKTALDVAQARGVIMLALAKAGLEPRSLTPNQIKRDLTGDGSADKRQVQDMLLLQFGLEQLPKPDDAADALAVAFSGVKHLSLPL